MSTVLDAPTAAAPPTGDRPMSDIVERIRLNSARTSYRPDVEELLLEAADEITRLREALKEMESLHTSWNAYDGE
jgi:hypothetical protein